MQVLLYNVEVFVKLLHISVSLLTLTHSEGLAYIALSPMAQFGHLLTHALSSYIQAPPEVAQSWPTHLNFTSGPSPRHLGHELACAKIELGYYEDELLLQLGGWGACQMGK